MKYTVTVEPGGKKIPVNTVYCLGKNYAAHAREMGENVPSVPVVFMKPATAVVDGEAPVILPSFSDEIHYEIELVLLVENVPRNTAADDAFQYIIAYGVGLDLTARDIQSHAKKNGLPWTTAKGFDASAPVSKFIKLNNKMLPEKTQLKLTINNKTKQQAVIGEMILPISAIVEHLSKYFTLRRGDLIFTGTPEGVGRLQPGDKLTVELVDFVSFSTRVQKS